METCPVARKPVLAVLSAVSIVMPVIDILLILNWLLKLTPFQKLEGFPLLLGAFASPFGAAAGTLSYIRSKTGAALLGIVLNIITFAVPFLYMYLGAILFGP